MSLRSVRALIALTALSLAVPFLGAAVAPTETDPTVIMQAVETRERADKVTARVKMVITDGSGRKRERVMVQRSMLIPGGSKQLMLFESPGDVRNTGLLSVDYDDGGKDDDQWLYLPSLRKSTRISSGDKSGSFMGSDLSFADMTRADPDDYTYKMIDADAKIGDEAVWRIEARPKTKKAKDETGYVKIHFWVSKDKLVPLQGQMWIAEGRRIKQMKFSGYKKIDGLWTPHRISARTKRNGKTESTTLLSFSKLRHNDPSVSAADFSQRALEKGL